MTEWLEGLWAKAPYIGSLVLVVFLFLRYSAASQREFGKALDKVHEQMAAEQEAQREWATTQSEACHSIQDRGLTVLSHCDGTMEDLKTELSIQRSLGGRIGNPGPPKTRQDGEKKPGEGDPP